MPDSKPTGGDCGRKAGDSSETEHQNLAFFADVILPVRNKAAILQDNCRKLKLQHFTPCYDFNGGVNPDLTMWGIMEQQDSNWLHSFFFQKSLCIFAKGSQVENLRWVMQRNI